MGRHARLAIEDPFEVGYDVAHVVTDTTQARLRNEFARAYRILIEGFESQGENPMDNLFATVESACAEGCTTLEDDKSPPPDALRMAQSLAAVTLSDESVGANTATARTPEKRAP